MDREGDAIITLKWNSASYIVNMEGGGWNWIRIVYSSGFWY